LADKIIELTNHNPIDVYGVNNKKIDFIATQFPKLKILVRGSEIRINGEAKEIAHFEETLNTYLGNIDKYGSAGMHTIDKLMYESLIPKSEEEDVLVFGTHGLIIKARTTNQKKLVSAVKEHDMVFAIGPAGSGKTYTAVALAVKALKNKEDNSYKACS
jgi:phosphate starvation-inducible protein PhoH and related proteins